MDGYELSTLYTELPNNLCICMHNVMYFIASQRPLIDVHFLIWKLLQLKFVFQRHQGNCTPLVAHNYVSDSIYTIKNPSSFKENPS